MSNKYVIGYSTTKFGELWDYSLYDLVQTVTGSVLEKTKLEAAQVDAVFYGNMMAGIIENNLHSGAKLAELLGTHVPVYRTESACASGGMAFHLATMYLDAHPDSTVLVIGAEKMTDVSPPDVTSALQAAASGEEQLAGLTFPGLYAMLARMYMETYNYTEEHLAHVPVKNHFHAVRNPYAQFRREITINQVLKSPYIATPLKVLDSSPISDGAAAVLLTNSPNIRKRVAYSVRVLASEVATDTISIKHRRRMDTLQASVVASNKAYAACGITAKEISVAEVHDCFSIAELLAMEDLGFWAKGEAGSRIVTGETRLDAGGSLVVNASGGLKASGHPVGATGIKQIGELFLQLTGQADSRQVAKARYGLAQNVGGSGGTAVVTILGQV
ncbi:MAG: thiolase domain-containing protein [Patescibacteria group bacterium]|nr:thiolase domain-containing protein [Patescibacteria group bacterium]